MNLISAVMVRDLFLGLSLSLAFVFLVGRIDGFNLTEYVAVIERLSDNEKFVDEYIRRSTDLFSDPDYLYGPKPAPFPCPTSSMSSPDVPTSVHSLRPADIQCVAALGDSLTAAMGAHAITPVGVLLENRGLLSPLVSLDTSSRSELYSLGVSWSIGGEHGYSRVLSLPNILRLYNPSLKGFSTKTSVSFLDGQNAKHNGLNVGQCFVVSSLCLNLRSMFIVCSEVGRAFLSFG